ncbi:MAG: methyltransferase type 12 [Rhodospirillaceae bacterium]|nr:methyltransferase type 12 [Rhodospirillaceae bacterium]OUT80736.1 MAG: hypothetical protein CBB83_00655 [Rhodospirillaceae bacterium TMED23]
MNKCRICFEEISQIYHVREMLMGLREVFEYYECGSCGCLQISSIPEDLDRFYPKDYYSLQSPKIKKARLIRDYVRKTRALSQIFGTNLLGHILSVGKPLSPINIVYRRIGLHLDHSILDVGGGAGNHVLSLRNLGFNKAMSLDPFIQSDVMHEGSLLAKKAEIFDLSDKYDLITFHHSFEHMDGQLKILKKAAELIGSKGRILIRIPTVTSEAWLKYRENWVGLDAPRHLYLHSHKSIRFLAAEAKLKILDFWNDSEAMQFWGSEQYLNNIPLDDPRSYAKNTKTSIFTDDQIREFKSQSVELNKKGSGDWVCLVLGT